MILHIRIEMLADLLEVSLYFSDQIIFTKTNLLLNYNCILSVRAHFYQKSFKADK